MKKLFLIALVALPFTSEAVCMRPFPVSGYGINLTKAREALEAKVHLQCGDDNELGYYSQRVDEVSYSDAEENAEYPVKASATYRCCFPW